jgi:GTPase SAR1 family protein
MSGNPLTGIHQMFNDVTDPQQYRVAIQQCLEGKQQACTEWKVMVVGEAGVGKTTMLRRLAGWTAADTQKRPPIATDGVDLGDLHINGIRFVCWDFAGEQREREREKERESNPETSIDYVIHRAGGVSLHTPTLSVR